VEQREEREGKKQERVRKEEGERKGGGQKQRVHERVQRDFGKNGRTCAHFDRKKTPFTIIN